MRFHIAELIPFTYVHGRCRIKQAVHAQHSTPCWTQEHLKLPALLTKEQQWHQTILPTRRGDAVDPDINHDVACSFGYAITSIINHAVQFDDDEFIRHIMDQTVNACTYQAIKVIL